MLDSARGWFRRNRTTFAVGAGVLGAGYVAAQYVLGKLTETRQRMGDDRIAKENLRRRFEQNQEDCTFTVLAILPTATENLLEALPVEQALAELQRGKAERLARSVGPSEVSTADLPSAPPSLVDGENLTDTQSGSFVHASTQLTDSTTEASADGTASTPTTGKRSKVQLWNEIKIQSIARAFTLIYTLCLLTLLTRIQLNLLGRRNYLASVVSLAVPPKHSDSQRITMQNNDDDGMENAYGNDFETNRKYLSFSWWLLHRGCRDIKEKVQRAVQEIFGTVSPREDVSLQKLSELVVLIRKRVEGFTEEERRNTKWLPYLLPPAEQEDYVLQSSGMLDSSRGETASATPFLRRLLDETSDLIESPAFSHVLTLLLDSAFTLLIDGKVASAAYKIPPISASSSRVQELVAPGEAKTKLANTLAVFCRQAHSIGSGATNEYLESIERVRDLEAFAAVVYSSNFDWENAAPDAAPDAAAPLPSAARLLGDAMTRGVDADAEPILPKLGVTDSATDGKELAQDAEASFVAVGQGESSVQLSQADSVVEPLIHEPEADLEKAWGKALAKEDGSTAPVS